MVEARRMVRWHFGRDHHPVRRKLAQVLVTMAWPLAVLLNLWQVAALVRTAGGIAEASSRGTLGRDPPQHFAERVLRYIELWQPDRRMNIDNYLYPMKPAPVQGAQPAVRGRSNRRQAGIL